MTLAELALAYTIFPNEGWRPAPPHILDRIEDKGGHIVWQAEGLKVRTPVIDPAVAYQITSCLTDALKEGTGTAGYEKYGLKNFPAAGKTGTAYDFTDALFAGYDSAITCVVWAGFDKPQPIYRGAFGSVLAEPIWVDLMNASTARYTPEPFPVPPTLHKVEICATSGLLATDKCYENVKSATGNVVRRRTSYVELATNAQMPTDACDVHGDTVRTQLVKQFDEGQWPRAALAVNTKEVAAVEMKAPTLVAHDDPYNAIGSTFAPKGAAPATSTEPVASAFDPDKPIKRAIAVTPGPQAPVEIRRAEPVRPMDEAAGEPLLQAQPPPSMDFSDGGPPQP